MAQKPPPPTTIKRKIGYEDSSDEDDNVSEMVCLFVIINLTFDNIYNIADFKGQTVQA
jgi:hypothetical protein